MMKDGLCSNKSIDRAALLEKVDAKVEPFLCEVLF